MKAQLAGIASHTGMEGVFRLLGADVYGSSGRGASKANRSAPPRRARPAGRACAARSRAPGALRRPDELLDARAGRAQRPARHPPRDGADARRARERLYTVASCGYATSGVGSEIAIGQGVIGVAARERTPVRISHMTNAAHYSHAMRSSLGATCRTRMPPPRFPFPGLAEPHSQLAVPIVASGRLLGVLFVESPMTCASASRTRTRWSRSPATSAPRSSCCRPATKRAPDAGGRCARRRGRTRGRRAARGAPLSRQRQHLPRRQLPDQGRGRRDPVEAAARPRQQGRTEFTNRELRLDPALRLPDVTDNLEARLVLLQRRLRGARRAHPHREDRARPLPAAGRAAGALRTGEARLRLPPGPGPRAVPARAELGPLACGEMRRGPGPARRRRPARAPARACRPAWRRARRGFMKGTIQRSTAIISSGGMEATSASWIVDQFGIGVARPQHGVVRRLLDVHVLEVVGDEQRQRAVHAQRGGRALPPARIRSAWPAPPARQWPAGAPRARARCAAGARARGLQRRMDEVVLVPRCAPQKSSSSSTRC